MMDTRGSTPSLRSSFPSRFHTLRAFPASRRTTGQLSYDRSKILPRYLKFSTPSMHSASSSPVRLNVAPSHRLARNSIWVCTTQYRLKYLVHFYKDFNWFYQWQVSPFPFYYLIVFSQLWQVFKPKIIISYYRYPIHIIYFLDQPIGCVVLKLLGDSCS